MADRDVRIYEVGPRDGLQNESAPIATDAKLRFIELLADAGLREIEATSFVSPQAIPQLADADELMAPPRAAAGRALPGAGPERARPRARRRGCGAMRSASSPPPREPFTRANINMTIAESIDAFRPVIDAARERGWWSRGYVSTAFGCPYQGEVGEAAVVGVARELLELGVDEISASATRSESRGRPTCAASSARCSRPGIGADRLAMHFHDTRGTALANVAAALELGIRCFDASTGGTGGCPYAPGAAGNLATEDLVYLLDREGMSHGVDLDGAACRGAPRSATSSARRSAHEGRPGGWLAGTIGRRWRPRSTRRPPHDR